MLHVAVYVKCHPGSALRVRSWTPAIQSLCDVIWMQAAVAWTATASVCRDWADLRVLAWNCCRMLLQGQLDGCTRHFSGEACAVVMPGLQAFSSPKALRKACYALVCVWCPVSHASELGVRT